MWRYAQNHAQTHRKAEYETTLAQLRLASETPILEHAFLREYVWVVHVSGFRASIISGKFPKLLRVHRIEDESGNYIPISKENLFSSKFHFDDVYQVWKNEAKAQAVQVVRRRIFEEGWEDFRDAHLIDRDPKKIGGLPFMGPALRCHMARNLGNLGVVKPDLHLNRLAKRYSFESAQKMCEQLSDQPAGITDLVLFFAAVDLGTT